MPSDITPSASAGKQLPIIVKKKKKLSRQEKREKARKKGSEAKAHVTNIEDTKAAVGDYEDAMDAGEAAEDFKQRAVKNHTVDV